MKRLLLLDLDGVIIDLATHLFSYYDVPCLEDEYPDGYMWDIGGAVNHIREQDGLPAVPMETFWSTLSYNFWRNLPQYPTARNFIEWLEMSGELEVCFCTASAGTPESVAGRYDWVKDYYPNKVNSMFMTSNKSPLGRIPGAILIDDSDKNVDDFRAVGGDAILVPRPWNSDYYNAKCWKDATPRLDRRPVYNVVATDLAKVMGDK